MLVDKEKVMDLVDIEVSCLELASGNYTDIAERNEELIRIANIASSMASHMRCSLRPVEKRNV